MARRSQRQSGATRTASRSRRARDLDNDGIIPVLARAVREVETQAQRGPVPSSGRTKFQVVALLVREERARLKTDESLNENQRAEQFKRLDGVATILAKTAARDTSLLMLLAEDAVVSEGARALKREMLAAAGVEVVPDEPTPAPTETAAPSERQVVPQSVVSAKLANPFLVPDFSAARAQADRCPSARHLGAARPALPLLRVRRSVVLHAACPSPAR